MRAHGAEAARPVSAVHTCHKGRKVRSLLLARPPTPDWEDNCQRQFESIVEQAAQADGEVRIGAMTWYQGNPSMPDAVAA